MEYSNTKKDPKLNDMSSNKRSEEPPSYNEATNQNDQLKLTYENQNNRYPRGNQYPSVGSAPYPGNQYQPQCTPQDQVMLPLANQAAANGDVIEAERQSRIEGYCVAVSFVIGIILITFGVLYRMFVYKLY